MSSLKDDPSSRLKALEKMGVVENFDIIHSCTVAIVGVGGVGAVVAEMLTRCGIGKLILFDYDDIELANMNRLFYTPKQLGLPKVEAAKETLNVINNNVLIEPINCNICRDYELFYDKIVHGSLTGSQVDLVLSCVDNYAARVTINKACCKADQVWMNSGVSENATSGQIQTCIPGVTACFLCAPPYIVATKGDESKIKRADVCTASLPTTMGVVAGLLAHNALKYLLKFGEVTNFLSYNSLQEFFPTYSLSYTPDCSEKYCVQRQLEKVEHIKSNNQLNECNNCEETKGEVIHPDNEFEIQVMDAKSFEEVEPTTPEPDSNHVKSNLSLTELRKQLMFASVTKNS